MTRYEQGNTQETVGQQFIDYVTAHTDPPIRKLDPKTICETAWKIDIQLPLLRDAIEEVSFVVRNLQSGNESPNSNPVYDIGIHTQSGLNSYFTYEPHNADTPYTYSGVEGQGAEVIEEGDVVKLLSELREY